MFSDKIKLLPISEINSDIINDLGNYGSTTIKYFYDKTLFNNVKVLKCTNNGHKVTIEKFRHQINTINLYDFLGYNQINLCPTFRRHCCFCDELCCYPWYEKEMKTTVSSQIYNPLNLPVMKDSQKLLPRCMCERCYNLFPYIKFYELSDKILLLKEFPDNIVNDIKQYIFYFLIMI